MEIPATLPSPVSRSPPRPTSRRVIDYKIRSSDVLTGSYVFDGAQTTQPDQFNLFSFQETHTFAHNLVNSARFGVNRVVAEIGLTPTALQPIVRGPPFGLRKPRRRIAILYNVCTVDL